MRPSRHPYRRFGNLVGISREYDDSNWICSLCQNCVSPLLIDSALIHHGNLPENLEIFCHPLCRHVQHQHLMVNCERSAPLYLRGAAQVISEPHFPDLQTPSGRVLRTKNGVPLRVLEHSFLPDPEQALCRLHLRYLTHHQILPPPACSTFITLTLMA